MATTTDKATPRPWTYHANYIEVSNEHGDHSLYAPDDRGAVSPETRWANARFVVQAVNAHDDLVAALERFLYVERDEDGLCPHCDQRIIFDDELDDDDKGLFVHKDDCPIAVARSVLAKAEGA